MESLPSHDLSCLTPRECDCLALVAAGFRSKEIAPVLGIEPGTVDVTLKRAGRRAGISDRKALARLLQDREPEMIQSILQRLGQVRKPLVGSPAIIPDEVVASVGSSAKPDWWWPVPSSERQWNDLSAWQKRAWTMIIGLGTLAVGALLIAVAHYALLEAAATHST